MSLKKWKDRTEIVFSKQCEEMLRFLNVVSETINIIRKYESNIQNSANSALGLEKNANLSRFLKHHIESEMSLQKEHTQLLNIIRIDVMRCVQESREIFSNTTKNARRQFQQRMKEIKTAENVMEKAKARYDSALQRSHDVHNNVLTFNSDKDAEFSGNSVSPTWLFMRKGPRKLSEMQDLVRTQLRTVKDCKATYFNSRKDLEIMCNREELKSIINLLQERLKKCSESIDSASMRVRRVLELRMWTKSETRSFFFFKLLSPSSHSLPSVHSHN